MPTKFASLGLVAVVFGVALAAVGFSIQGSPPATEQEQLMDMGRKIVSAPLGQTFQELGDGVVAIHKGLPLPTGWSIVKDQGEAKITMTGYIDIATGKKGAQVSAIADINDMEYVDVLESGVVIATATKANGMITTRGTVVLASLLVLLDPALPAEYSVEIVSPEDLGGQRTRTSFTVEAVQ